MVELDAERRTVHVGGKPVRCTKLEFDVLAALLAADGRVLSASYLLDTVWETEPESGTTAVKVMVGTLRRKLGAESWRLDTVRGVGWRFRQDNKP